MTYQARVWWHGLVAAVIGGVSNSVIVIMVDPMTFNLFNGGAKKLGIVMAASGVLAFFTYTKEHPLPDPAKDIDFHEVQKAAITEMKGTGDGR